MLVIMRAPLMRNGFGAMAVNMKMRGAVAMPMLMEMHAIAPQSPQHMRAEPDQHDSDRCFQRARDVFGDDTAEQNSNARKDKQCDGVTQPPGQPMFDNVTDIRAPRRDTGHRRDMVRLERVLHSEQETKT